MRPNTTGEYVLKVRIRFSKTGALVYIGHLDVMRYFQKLFRRSRIPVAYSEGFSPHQLLSFSHPLPLGMESCGEYADVTLTRPVPTEEALECLRHHSVPEIEIMSFKELPDKCDNAMASVCAAKYTACLDRSVKGLNETVERFLSTECVNILKKTKKNEQEINIRPLVHLLECNSENDILTMTISSGSSNNCKPELVIDALKLLSEDSPDHRDFVYKRIDQFTDCNRLISLDMIGHDIL